MYKYLLLISFSLSIFANLLPSKSVKENTDSIHDPNDYLKDTVPVIILACDTSEKPPQTVFVNKQDRSKNQPFWGLGYDVSMWVPGGFYGGKQWMNGYWNHLYYLDENLKFIPKEVVVLLTKEREKSFNY
jgi:hypothetical protein